jgi:hypothetical protein
MAAPAGSDPELPGFAEQDKSGSKAETADRRTMVFKLVLGEGSRKYRREGGRKERK